MRRLARAWYVLDIRIRVLQVIPVFQTTRTYARGQSADRSPRQKWPRHPELGVSDSWEPERFVKEMERLRAIGLEPIPKMNFSTCHDAWLKDYGHQVSTPRYY